MKRKWFWFLTCVATVMTATTDAPHIDLSFSGVLYRDADIIIEYEETPHTHECLSYAVLSSCISSPCCESRGARGSSRCWLGLSCCCCCNSVCDCCRCCCSVISFFRSSPFFFSSCCRCCCCANILLAAAFLAFLFAFFFMFGFGFFPKTLLGTILSSGAFTVPNISLPSADDSIRLTKVLFRDSKIASPFTRPSTRLAFTTIVSARDGCGKTYDMT